MRFFKLVEIDEKEYIQRTRDLDFDYFAQSVNGANKVYPNDKNLYIAINESEEEIRINLEYVEDDEEWEDE